MFSEPSKMRLNYLKTNAFKLFGIHKQKYIWQLIRKIQSINIIFANYGYLFIFFFFYNFLSPFSTPFIPFETHFLALVRICVPNGRI